MDITKLDGKYISPVDPNYYMEIKNGEYIIDYGDGGEIETGKIELNNNKLYTIEQETINDGYNFKYEIGTIRDNRIERIYKKYKETNKYKRYILEEQKFLKTLDLYPNDTFEFEYKAKYNSTFKSKSYKSGIYKMIGNQIELLIKTTYEKNIFNKKINERPATQLIGDNYYIDEKYNIDENGDLYVIEFIKQ